jgi:hypothetical protein
MTEYAYIPPVVITSLTQGWRSPAGGRPDSCQSRELTLDWRENSFEFEYAALSYILPEKNRYQYLLEGFDLAWFDTPERDASAVTPLARRNLHPARQRIEL